MQAAGRTAFRTGDVTVSSVAFRKSLGTSQTEFHGAKASTHGHLDPGIECSGFEMTGFDALNWSPDGVKAVDARTAQIQRWQTF